MHNLEDILTLQQQAALDADRAFWPTLARDAAIAAGAGVVLALAFMGVFA